MKLFFYLGMMITILSCSNNPNQPTPQAIAQQTSILGSVTIDPQILSMYQLNQNSVFAQYGTSPTYGTVILFYNGQPSGSTSSNPSFVLQVTNSAISTGQLAGVNNTVVGTVELNNQGGGQPVPYSVIQLCQSGTGANGAYSCNINAANGAFVTSGPVITDDNGNNLSL